MNPAKKAPTRPKAVRKVSKPTPVKPGVLSRKSKEEKKVLKSPPPTIKKKMKEEPKTPLTFGQVNIQNTANRQIDSFGEGKPSPSKTAFEFKPVVKSNSKVVNDDTHAERSNSFDGLDKLTANMRSQGTSLDSMSTPQDSEASMSSPPREKFSKDTQLCFMYIKPHCSGIKGIDKIIIEMLKEAGVEIIDKGLIFGKTIASQGLIDNHYSAMSSKAMKLQPTELVVPASGQAEFQQVFGIGWARAVEENVVFNASDAASRLRVDATGLNSLWKKIPSSAIVRLGRGFYCGKVKLDEPEDSDDCDGFIYVVNGFYLALKNSYTNPNTKVSWFSLKLPTFLSWETFRSDVIGSINPLTAPEDSIRRKLVPLIDSSAAVQAALVNEQDNFIHASASPLEAMFERLNWLYGLKDGNSVIETDHFGSQLIEAGLTSNTVLNWRSDPIVTFEGSPQSVFDIHENVDTLLCVRKAVAVSASEEKLMALRRRQRMGGD